MNELNLNLTIFGSIRLRNLEYMFIYLMKFYVYRGAIGTDMISCTSTHRPIFDLFRTLKNNWSYSFNLKCFVYGLYPKSAQSDIGKSVCETSNFVLEFRLEF